MAEESDRGEGATYLAVGHVSADLGPVEPRRGGTVTYACRAAAAWGWRARCATVAAPPFDVAPRDRGPGPASVHRVEWRARRAATTTTFRNWYDPDGQRRQELVALAPKLERGDIPPAWRRADVLHIAPVAGEVAPGILTAVEADFVGVTPQGWLRQWGRDGTIMPGQWRVPEAITAACDAMVVSEEDLAGAGVDVEHLAARVAVLAVTAGMAGARIWEAGKPFEIGAVPARSRDPTGAGDVFAATLFMALAEGEDVHTAARLAAAAAACTVEVVGAVGFSRAVVVARMTRWEPL